MIPMVQQRHNEEVNSMVKALDNENPNDYMDDPEPGEMAVGGRGGSSLFWTQMAEAFIETNKPVQKINYIKMGRKWGAVAQSLRVALKETPLKNGNGEALSSIAFVSVNKADETIYLKRREVEGAVGRGRPKKS
jgi:hypothetical protein